MSLKYPPPTPQLALLLGVDGSGKSTFLEGAEKALGYTILEPTSSVEARQFKQDTLDRLINKDLIEQREEIYTRLNGQFDEQVQEHLDNRSSIATTGNLLVTYASHRLMASIVDSSCELNVRQITETWYASQCLKPTVIVAVHAPDEVIRSRISERQARGDDAEKFWGFNSPYYLSRYQDLICDLISELSEAGEFPSVSYDTSRMNKEEIIQDYVSLITNL